MGGEESYKLRLPHSFKVTTPYFPFSPTLVIFLGRTKGKKEKKNEKQCEIEMEMNEGKVTTGRIEREIMKRCGGCVTGGGEKRYNEKKNEQGKEIIMGK